MRNYKTMREMKRLLYILLSIPLASAGQETGIRFDSAHTWVQITAKAKAEHKYIFVDCYATWCSPCKEMDKNVYMSSKIGERFNADFVSVKVQMDKTKKDDPHVMSWYSAADSLQRAY